MSPFSDEPCPSRREIARDTLRLVCSAIIWVGFGGPAPLALRAQTTVSFKDATRRMTKHDFTEHPYRLPRWVIPSHYDLRLEPDLQAHSFTGHEVITITVVEETSDIVLNATELTVLSVLLSAEGQTPREGRIALEEEHQRCRITFPSVIHPGIWRLSLSFRGTLNDKLRGFYRSTYKDDQGMTHDLAATQFEATDARRAFPCWDEPDFKAVFSVTLVFDQALNAISNTRVVDDRLEAGKRVVRFADSIKMSTYLVAFIVGRFEATAPMMAQQTPVRLWSVPGKQHLTSFGQEIAVYSLNFLADYYGIPYPGGKLDLIAIPDFASGAMENLGAITFRETALLLDQRTATHAEQARVADVVAHENAHMWFGDLVTMAWWNGLWLNEAFATFMEMLVVDAWKPEWERWTAFGVSRAAALSVDGLLSTRSIEYPVREPKEAEAMFDVLTYEKGASVLRMLEQHIGPSVFRSGIRHYLTTHAYGNAETTDLWLSLGHAAGIDVPDLMNEWIFSPGYPLITLQLDSSSTLTISQRRFTYIQGEPKVAPPNPDPNRQRWQVPIQLRISTPEGCESRRVLLTDQVSRIPLPNSWTTLLANEGGHGFYRVRYAPELIRRLEETGVVSLAAVERFNLLNDAWASTIAGLSPPAEYLSLTEHFRQEKDPNVWAVLLGSFSTVNDLLIEAERPLLAALVQDRVGPVLQDLGWDARSGERELVRELRGHVIRALGTLGRDEQVQERALAMYAAYRRQRQNVDPNVLPALVSILAFTGNSDRYEEFLEAFRKAATPQDERRYLFSLTAFKDPSLAERTLASTLNGEVRTQDAPFLVSALLHNVYSRERAWKFVKRNWDRMDQLFPKSGVRRMCGGIVGLSTPELERDVHAFFEAKKIDLGGKTLEQYLEQLHIAVTFRERDRKAIREYLARPSTS